MKLPADGAWREARGNDAWARFDRIYGFRASVDPDEWPGIDEPPGSVTFDVSEDPDIDRLVVAALAEIVGPDEEVLVLDWQHTSFWFRPHRSTTPPETWPVAPVPDGDYCVFLTEDMASGTFGHPWEASLCILGCLVPILAPRLEPDLLVLRDARS